MVHHEGLDPVSPIGIEEFQLKTLLLAMEDCCRDQQFVDNAGSKLPGVITVIRGPKGLVGVGFGEAEKVLRNRHEGVPTFLNEDSAVEFHERP